MKRFVIMFMVLGLVAGSVATVEAKGKKRDIRIERTVEGSYGPYPAPITGCNLLRRDDRTHRVQPGCRAPLLCR